MYNQKVLKAKKRLGGLRKAIFGGIDDSASNVESAVKQAVADWRAEHEEALIKQKFAKKNFAALENLIPDLVKEIMSKAQEGNHTLTHGDVKSAVYYVLNRRFASDKNILKESPIDRTSVMRGMIEISKLLKEISEADMRDSDGKIVIEPGLKVRHKKSGLEYTVQDVDDSDQKTRIIMAVPEVPRIDVGKTPLRVVTEKDSPGELDSILSTIEREEETVFVVDEKEFEKNYEVK